MSKRPIELVLESALSEASRESKEPRWFSSMQYLADQRYRVVRRNFKHFVQSNLEYYLGDLMEAGVSNRRVYLFAGLLSVSAASLDAVLLVEAQCVAIADGLRRLWYRLIFGPEYEKAYPSAYFIRQQEVPWSDSARLFSPALLARLEEEEELVNTGHGFRIRKASALLREGI